MKCPIHGCEMAIVKLGVGWGDEVERECLKCKEELVQASQKGEVQANFSKDRAGWQ